MLTLLQNSWISLVAGGYGAFKPPANNLTSSIIRSGHDPRDAKHPLSICQLTNGNSESASAAGDTFSMTTSNNQMANPAALEFAAICAANAVANSAALLGVSGLR